MGQNSQDGRLVSHLTLEEMAQIKLTRGLTSSPPFPTPVWPPGVWAIALCSLIPSFTDSLHPKVCLVFIQHFYVVSVLELKFPRYGRGNWGLRGKSHGQFIEKPRTHAQAHWLLCLPSIIRAVSWPPLARPQEIDALLLKCTLSTEMSSVARDKACESLNGF